VKSFGVQRECTPQTFVVIFGHSVAVTNGKLKVFTLLLYGAVGFGSIIGPMLFLLLYKRLHATPFKLLSGAVSNSQAPGLESLSKRVPNLLVQLLATIKTTEVWIILLVFILSLEIFPVASTEVLVQRSKGLVLPGELQWTFGQSLAVMLVTSPLFRTIDSM